MKIIRNSYEKEVTCPKCKALLYYVTKDIHLVGDMDGNDNYCIKCPECGKEIKINKDEKTRKEFIKYVSRMYLSDQDKEVKQAIAYAIDYCQRNSTNVTTEEVWQEWCKDCEMAN